MLYVFQEPYICPYTCILTQDVSIILDGVAEIEFLGVEINSFDNEVSVLVCNFESDSADCYTALPADVTGTTYYTVSDQYVNEVRPFISSPSLT